MGLSICDLKNIIEHAAHFSQNWIDFLLCMSVSHIGVILTVLGESMNT